MSFFVKSNPFNIASKGGLTHHIWDRQGDREIPAMVLNRSGMSAPEAEALASNLADFMAGRPLSRRFGAEDRLFGYHRLENGEGLGFTFHVAAEGQPGSGMGAKAAVLNLEPQYREAFLSRMAMHGEAWSRVMESGVLPERRAELRTSAEDERPKPGGYRPPMA